MPLIHAGLCSSLHWNPVTQARKESKYSVSGIWMEPKLPKEQGSGFQPPLISPFPTEQHLFSHFYLGPTRWALWMNWFSQRFTRRRKQLSDNSQQDEESVSASKAETVAAMPVCHTSLWTSMTSWLQKCSTQMQSKPGELESLHPRRPPTFQFPHSFGGLSLQGMFHLASQCSPERLNKS